VERAGGAWRVVERRGEERRGGRRRGRRRKKEKHTGFDNNLKGRVLNRLISNLDVQQIFSGLLGYIVH
jgi:hypothetical protein